MSNQERQPITKNGFDRESINYKTPHGKAQARFYEMLEISKKYGIPVQYSVTGESSEPFEPPPSAQEIVLSNAVEITPNGSTCGEYKTRNPKKPLRTHNTTGLNGFYKGTFYRDGVAQRPKNRQGK